MKADPDRDERDASVSAPCHSSGSSRLPGARYSVRVVQACFVRASSFVLFFSGKINKKISQKKYCSSFVIHIIL